MYSIGQFSKICQVSVRTLRYYDRIGLLRPWVVDPDSGYRYYETEQMHTLLAISRLQRYGLTLEEIGSLLDAPADTLRQALLRQREKLLREQQELTAALYDLNDHIHALREKGDKLHMSTHVYEISLTTAQPLSVISTRQRMSVDDFGYWYGVLYERIAREGLHPDGVFGAMYHDEVFDRDSADIEVFIGIRERERADRLLPACRCATTIHYGSYSALPEAYAAIAAYLDEHQYTWHGAPYELYLKTARDGLPMSEWETALYWPLADEV